MGIIRCVAVDAPRKGPCGAECEIILIIVDMISVDASIHLVPENISKKNICVRGRLWAAEFWSFRA